MKNENNLARKIVISTLLLTLFFICLSSVNASDVYMNSTNNTISNAVVNETNNGDTIYLDQGTYNHTHLNDTNGININKNLTIIGKGTEKTIIDAQKQGRLFNITSNGTLTLINLSIINGHIGGYGGAIYNDGSLNITNCILTNSNATNFGGAIYNLKTLTISNCKLTNNIASSWGGVIYNYNANITINNSDFINNTGNTRGGAILGRAATNITIFNSNFINNTVTGTGGAITAYDTTTTLHLSNCNFINNIANETSGAGGAIALYYAGNRSIKNCTFINNTATSTNPYYSGGAIYNNAGYLTITNSLFTNNTAVYGGAIYNDGNVIIESSYIFNNHGTYGVIFSANNTTIKYSRIFNNTIYDIYIATYDYPGYTSVVNASFNWWGTNDPDLEIKAGGRIRGTGNFTIDNFFVMNVINLTALDSNKNLIFNYTFGLNNTDHFDPSLLPYFETNFYNNITGLIESFDARYNKTLTDTITAKNKTIKYSFTTDNETQSFNARIDPGNSNITVNSPNGKNGETVNLVVNLTDENGNPLTGKTIKFNVAGRIFTSVTDENGVAKINYIIDKNDFVNNKLNFTVSFEGDEEYLSTNETGIITLDKTQTNLVVNGSNGKIGETVVLIAKLTDENGNPLSKKVIKFYIDGVYVGVAITDVNGVARFSYKPTKQGNFTITATFEGDDAYLNSTSKNSLTITTKPAPTPTPSPEPSNNNTKPTNQTNNKLINTNKTNAVMKETGIPIITILIMLLSSLGLIYRKK